MKSFASGLATSCTNWSKSWVGDYSGIPSIGTVKGLNLHSLDIIVTVMNSSFIRCPKIVHTFIISSLFNNWTSSKLPWTSLWPSIYTGSSFFFFFFLISLCMVEDILRTIVGKIFSKVYFLWSYARKRLGNSCNKSKIENLGIFLSIGLRVL